VQSSNLETLNNIVQKYGLEAIPTRGSTSCSECSLISKGGSGTPCTIQSHNTHGRLWCTQLDDIVIRDIVGCDGLDSMNFRGVFNGDEEGFVKDVALYMAMANTHS
jgi:hypothetical protein